MRRNMIQMLDTKSRPDIRLRTSLFAQGDNINAALQRELDAADLRTPFRRSVLRTAPMKFGFQMPAAGAAAGVVVADFTLGAAQVDALLWQTFTRGDHPQVAIMADAFEVRISPGNFADGRQVDLDAVLNQLSALLLHSSPVAGERTDYFYGPLDLGAGTRYDGIVTTDSRVPGANQFVVTKTRRSSQFVPDEPVLVDLKTGLFQVEVGRTAAMPALPIGAPDTLVEVVFYGAAWNSALGMPEANICGSNTADLHGFATERTDVLKNGPAGSSVRRLVIG